MSKFLLAPSILSADFSRLGEEVENVLAAGADIIHFDVMDNHFVPNLTIGPLVCVALRNYGIVAEIDVHLMIEPVDRIIPAFAKAGASYITFHPEASENVGNTLRLVRQQGCKPGLVLNPATSLDVLSDFIHQIDVILLMSVIPGFAGQQFIPETLEKIAEAKSMIAQSGRSVQLEVDGGVKTSNIAEIAEAGADTFVAGSAIFDHRNPDDPNVYDSVITQMRNQLAKASANK